MQKAGFKELMTFAQLFHYYFIANLLKVKKDEESHHRNLPRMELLLWVSVSGVRFEYGLSNS